MTVPEYTKQDWGAAGREPAAPGHPQVQGRGGPDSSGCAQHLSRASAWNVVEMASSILAWSREAGPEEPGDRRPKILEEIRPCPNSRGDRVGAAAQEDEWMAGAGLWHPQPVRAEGHATPTSNQGVRTQGECLPNTEQLILLKEMPTLPHLPSLASYHLKCHTSSPTALHSALYLRMGTPPVASGSSNCTCAVLEYGSTWSMDGEDGVSVGRAHMETQVSPIRSRT